MRQLRIPEGETPKLKDFVPEKLFHHIVTRRATYANYLKSCKEAKEEAKRLRKEKREEGAYNPETFIQEWQQSPAYLKAESSYAQYSEEAKEIRRQNQADIGRAARKRIIRTLVPA